MLRHRIPEVPYRAVRCFAGIIYDVFFIMSCFFIVHSLSLYTHENKIVFQLISNKSFLNLLLKIEQSFCFLGIFHGPTLVSPLSLSSFSNLINTKPAKPYFFSKFTQVESRDWFTSFQEKRICLGWVDLPFFYHNLEVSTFVVLPPLVDQQISCLKKNFISAA